MEQIGGFIVRRAVHVCVERRDPRVTMTTAFTMMRVCTVGAVAATDVHRR